MGLNFQASSLSPKLHYFTILNNLLHSSRQFTRQSCCPHSINEENQAHSLTFPGSHCYQMSAAGLEGRFLDTKSNIHSTEPLYSEKNKEFSWSVCNIKHCSASIFYYQNTDALGVASEVTRQTTFVLELEGTSEVTECTLFYSNSNKWPPVSSQRRSALCTRNPLAVQQLFLLWITFIVMMSKF